MPGNSYECVDIEMAPTKPVAAIKCKVDLYWTDVCYNIVSSCILKQCWGKVPAGQLCALMGSSGAGKSSLLNILAGRICKSSDVSGDVLVGGTPMLPFQRRRNIAYVMQDDYLLSTTTPREAIRFSALLRLSHDKPYAAIEQLVDTTISDLGLKECENCLVGGQMIKGISGGQRKRVSIGIEVVTDPLLLLLDEPTSGLDAFTAFSTVNLLKKIANRQSSVLCTIHQPSSEVLALFDTVIFMHNGSVVYRGQVRYMLSYFSSLGHQCPKHHNPADFVLFLLQTQDVLKLQREQVEPFDSLDTLQNSLSVVELNESVEGVDSAGVETNEQGLASYYSWLFLKYSRLSRQLYYLSEREMLNAVRDTGALIGRFGVTAFMHILFGLIYENCGSKDNNDPDNFATHVSALSLVTMSAMFGSSQAVMLSFPFERPIFMREYSSQTYEALPYFLSKMLMELPLALAQTCLGFIFVYFMCSFSGNGWYMILSAWGLAVVSSSMAVFLGCFLTNVKDVAELGPLLFVPQLLFSGYFIKISQIPSYLQWIQYICGLKYGLNLELMLEFGPTGDACQGPYSQAYCQSLLKDNNVEVDQWWVNIVIMIAIFLCFRLFGGILLLQKAQVF